MATALIKPCSLLRQHIPAAVATQHAVQRLSSSIKTDEDIKPLKVADVTALKRGTGGRSSFNGIVATVFGGKSFIGNIVINRLGKQGTQVVIPHRGEAYNLRYLKLTGDLGQVLFVPINIRDEKSLYKAMKYSNVVINLIGKSNDTRNYSMEEVNVTAARNIARIARESGVKRLIHVSSLNAAEKPKGVILKDGSKFLATKWRGEIAVREEFPEAIIFRPSDVFGQGDHFLRYYATIWRHQLKWMPLWNRGVGIGKQPVYVSDLASGIMKSIFDPDAPGKTFQAVGPRRYELGELVDWFHKIMRKNKEDWGYRRINMKYNLLFWLQVYMFETIMKADPHLSWDRIEREHVTDVIIPELPTLEDLGITLTTMDDRIKYELSPFRAYGYYDEEFGEFEEPLPPPPFPAQV